MMWYLNSLEGKSSSMKEKTSLVPRLKTGGLNLLPFKPGNEAIGEAHSFPFLALFQLWLGSVLTLSSELLGLTVNFVPRRPSSGNELESARYPREIS